MVENGRPADTDGELNAVVVSLALYGGDIFEQYVHPHKKDDGDIGPIAIRQSKWNKCKEWIGGDILPIQISVPRTWALQ